MPSQVMEFLGLKINSSSMEFQVPKDKLKSIKKDIQQMIQQENQQQLVKLRKLAQVIGKLIAIELAVLPARLRTWELQHCKHCHMHVGWEGSLLLSKEAIEELIWWDNNMTKWNGRTIILGAPSVEVTSDASKIGWGGVCGNQSAQGLWSSIEKEYGNNLLELLAGGFAVQLFETEVIGHVVKLNMDNTTAVSYINKMGGSKMHLARISLQIWNWCLKRETFLIAQYLPGVDNITADKLSRNLIDRSDWKLNPKIFQALQNLWGPFQIDLFASRLNKQIDTFFSWHPEPGALAVNAFHQSWTNIKGWANPPFNLIAKVLNKIIQDKATVIVIAPIWPTQPWFPVILQLLSDWPILLPNQKDLFLPGFLGNDTPLDHTNWRVAAWNLCGKQASIKDFQQKLSHFLPRKANQLPEIIINMVGESFHSGGTNKALQMGIFHQLEL
jgi:hypothetical protein